MPDTKISALPASTSLGDTDELLLASAGVSRKITGANLKASIAEAVWTMALEVILSADGPITLNLSSAQGYNDLMIVVQARGTHTSGHETLALQFNGDTGNNYNRQGSSFSGTAAPVVVENLAQARLPIGTIPGTTDVSGFFGSSEIFIPAYSSATFKKLVRYTTYSVFSLSTGGSEYGQGGGYWNNVAAITSVTLRGVNQANLLSGAIARVYGRN